VLLDLSPAATLAQKDEGRTMTHIAARIGVGRTTLYRSDR